MQRNIFREVKKEKKRFINIYLLVLLSFFLFFVLLQPAVAKTRVLKNIGFIQSNIWYSKEPILSGEKVRIYSAVFNNSSYDLLGVAEFYDNGKPIGKSNFSIASGGGRLNVVWADWTAPEGNHKISAKIIDAKVSFIGGGEESVLLENSQTSENEIFIDADNDRDGVGNKEDEDDDNDGVLDATETQQGTNSLKADTDGDGISDKDDKNPLVFSLADLGEKDKIVPDDISEDSADNQDVSSAMENGKAPGSAFDFVKNAAKVAYEGLDNFLEKQGQKLEVKRQELKKEIEESKEVAKKQEGTEGLDFGEEFPIIGKGDQEYMGGSFENQLAQTESEDKSAFKITYFYLLSALSYILNHRILIYLVLFSSIALILIRFIMYVFRKAS